MVSRVWNVLLENIRIRPRGRGSCHAPIVRLARRSRLYDLPIARPAHYLSTSPPRGKPPANPVPLVPLLTPSKEPRPARSVIAGTTPKQRVRRRAAPARLATTNQIVVKRHARRAQPAHSHIPPRRIAQCVPLENGEMPNLPPRPTVQISARKELTLRLQVQLLRRHALTVRAASIQVLGQQSAMRFRVLNRPLPRQLSVTVKLATAQKHGYIQSPNIGIRA